MNALASVPGPAVREIPLSLLSLAPENVRKTPADSLSDAEIKASIAALGLLKNLVVRAAEPGDDGIERHPVIAGGRRLAALQALAAEGEIAADHPVPCLVRAGDADSEEVSLAENVVRVAMHPADQVEAFGKLAAAGQTVAAIAARFGTSERIVEQRLRLGNAAPELLDAYRADKIDLEVLKAFAITTDRERQLAWSGNRSPPRAIARILLACESPPNRGTRAGHVHEPSPGLLASTAYEAAGGAGPAGPLRARMTSRGSLVRGPGAPGPASPWTGSRLRPPTSSRAAGSGPSPMDRSLLGRHRSLPAGCIPLPAEPTDDGQARKIDDAARQASCEELEDCRRRLTGATEA